MCYNSCFLQYVVPGANPRNTAATSAPAGKITIPRMRDNTDKMGITQSANYKRAAITPPSARIDYTEDTNPEEATLSQGVRFEPDSLSSPQRKRTAEDEPRGTAKKRLKSSNMVQAINVGENED